jgi:PAS domain S-box-containing protein
MESNNDNKTALLKKENDYLKQLTTRYERLIQNIPDVIYSLDNKGHVVDINFPAIQFYGFSPEEIIGQHHLLFIYSDDHDTLIHSHKTALKEKNAWVKDLAFRVYDKQGDTHWVEVNSHKHFDKDGRFSHEEGVLRNINNRRQFEQSRTAAENDLMEEVWKRTVELESSYTRLEKKMSELSRTRKDLKINKTLLFSIINSLEDGIVVIGKDFRFTYWSKRLAQITGIPARDVLENKEKAWEQFPYLEQIGIEAEMKKAMQGQVVRINDIPFSRSNNEKGQGILSHTYFPPESCHR